MKKGKKEEFIWASEACQHLWNNTGFYGLWSSQEVIWKSPRWVSGKQWWLGRVLVAQQVGQPQQETSGRGGKMSWRDCSAYGYRQELLMVKKTVKNPIFLCLSTQQYISLKNKNRLSHFLLTAGSLVLCAVPGAGLGTPKYPACWVMPASSCGGAFSSMWVETWRNKGVETEAEIQCCAAPPRMPVGSNKPCDGPCKELHLVQKQQTFLKEQSSQNIRIKGPSIRLQSQHVHHHSCKKVA